MGLQLLRTLQSQMLKIGFSLVLGVVAIPKGAEAQVVPDGTLKSTVETIQELMKIDGGLTEGSNLFHSFEEFNIPEGMEASFENAIEIENIFTRVTGDSASTINGTLSAQGGANLFLMNPNGIVFGQDASINLGGSFIATTADSIQFQDGTEFAAIPSENPTPLLTNEIPIGLGFGSDDNSGEITVSGNGNEVSPPALQATTVGDNKSGLSVDPRNTLSLIGGEINTDGATLTAEDGNIQLGSVGFGVVNLQYSDDAPVFNFDNVIAYRNINLDNLTVLDASGSAGGNIFLDAANIALADGSLALIQSQHGSGTSFGNAEVSSRQNNSTASSILDINATDSITLSGSSEGGSLSSAIRTESVEKGEGADIKIATQQLSLQDGAGIFAVTYGSGSSGNVDIAASNTVELLENTDLDLARNGFVTTGIGSVTVNSGNAGSFNLSTNTLNAVDGGTLSTSTFGTGDAGDISIDADFINISGVNETQLIPSSVTSSTNDEGAAGTINIATSKLSLNNGASMRSSSFSTGNAGNINIDAAESIEVSGVDLPSENVSEISTSATATTESDRELLGTNSELSGSSGSITINSPDLDINSGATIGVSNEAASNAGTLLINANNVEIDGQGSITATSASGQGGNIEINTFRLQIENQSDITAEAENQGGGGNVNINATNITAKKNSDISANAEGGDGGNVTVDAETLLGLNNSDITANAVEGDGGNINITATSILGFEERPELTPNSDITASSEFGVDGTVTINSPETNAEEDVQVSAKKPETPLTPLELVKGCQLPEGILTTRGRGVPESPYPFPFGRFSYDEDVYKKAEETMRQERLRRERSSRQNGISKREAEEQRQERELAMLREKQRNLPNRHAHLMYEVTDDREVGPMLLPAPKGKLVEPADGRTDKNAIPAFYSQSNELPPISREKRLRQEGNVLVINPDGSKHFVRMFLMSHPTEEMCQNTVGRN